MAHIQFDSIEDYLDRAKAKVCLVMDHLETTSQKTGYGMEDAISSGRTWVLGEVFDDLVAAEELLVKKEKEDKRNEKK